MADIVMRELDNEGYRQLLNDISTAIDRCVDYGETVINAISNNPRDEYLDSTLILLFRDFLEYLDGISVLIKNSCIEASIPVLRSMFEHFLAILFILEKHQSNRAAAYQVAHVRSKLKTYKKFTPNEIGQVSKILEKSGFDFPLPETDPSDSILQLEELLTKGKFKIINDEWEKTKIKNGKKEPQWYSLYSGPRTFYDLANYLKKMAEYEFLYRTWSAKAHANSAFTSAIKSGSFKMIRYPESLQTVSTWALTWTFTLFQDILGYYNKRKLREFAFFYKQLNRLYRKVTNGKELVNINYD